MIRFFWFIIRSLNSKMTIEISLNEQSFNGKLIRQNEKLIT